MECILALPAQNQKEGSVINLKKLRKNKEIDDKREKLIEHDLQRSGNEIGTGNTKINNGKRTSKKYEKVAKVYPYFWGKTGDNGEENADEIVIEKIKSKNKRRLKEHEPQGDYENKVDTESCGYGSEENGGKIVIEKIISKRKRRLKKHEPKGENEKKVDAELCYYGSEGNGDESAIGKIKSKQKRRSKKHEPQGDNEKKKRRSKKHEPQGDNEKKVDAELCCYDSEENGDVIAFENIKSRKKKWSKKREPQGDNKEKIDPELCCYGCDIGFVDDKILADGTIKSKEKKKKKAAEYKLQENGDDAETSKFIFKKHEPQYDNKEKIDPESCCYGCDVGFVEDKLLADGKIKSKEKKKKKKAVEDKLWENGDAETSKFILKKCEPQGDNKEKNGPESCYYGCDIGFVEDKLLADGKIKSKEKKKKAVEDELRGNGDDAETSKFIFKKCEPQGDNKEKIDPELCCYGCDVGFVEDKLRADGKIKSEEKKKKKAVEDKLRENGDDAETSKFIFKKFEPEGDNKEKIDPESCCYGCDVGFVEDKLLADGTIKSKEKKKKAVEDKLRENGDDAETSKFIFMKCEPQGDNKEKIDPESCCYGCDIGFNGTESCYYGCDIGFVEDKLLADGKIKSMVKKKKKVVEDELRGNVDDAET
ncbi:hypothetical protein CR513_62258, partial [Mucuna pruriens]